jgi:hypothetical protein
MTGDHITDMIRETISYPPYLCPNGGDTCNRKWLLGENNGFWLLLWSYVYSGRIGACRCNIVRVVFAFGNSLSRVVKWIDRREEATAMAPMCANSRSSPVMAPELANFEGVCLVADERAGSSLGVDDGHSWIDGLATLVFFDPCPLTSVGRVLRHPVTGAETECDGSSGAGVDALPTTRSGAATERRS